MTAERRHALRRLLAAQDIDALLVTTPVNVRYLTGFTGSAGELLVSTDPQRDTFVTDGRYDEQAAGEVPEVRRLIVPAPRWVSASLRPGERLGVEAHAIPWARVRALQEDLAEAVTPAPRLVEQLRAVKDAEEIRSLAHACEIADAAFDDLAQWLRSGVTERTAAAALVAALAAAGSAPAFDVIFASGPNTALPHHRPGDRTLSQGDIVKVDFGAVVDGYHSDMTRMLSLGPPPPRLAEIYEVVHAAQQAGLDAAVAGNGTAEVDDACRSRIDEAGYAARFIHGTGHGVGLQIHEDPFLRPEIPRPEVAASPSVTLRTGMTVTVEPGIYLPGVGGVRIEDSLVVTPTAADVLTRTRKDLVVL